ncbi:MAG: 12-oxophytodienoate reductase, partial [Alphaproteobacteria bacterium]|nr:12-oxophytodienoate reductase [Alphaproteobacteria bacterium]
MNGRKDSAATPGAGQMDILFQPVRIGTMQVRNRIVMAPMTREFSPDGVPGSDVVEYYR